LANVAEGDAEDIDRAVAAARAAFNGPWSRFKPAERQRLLLRLAELVERDIEEFAALDTLDMGAPISRTRGGRQRALGMLRFYAGMATALHGETIDNSLPGEYVSFTLKEPVGVVGAIIPWNGPLSASIWKIGPALATGCTVVLKPAEEAPLTPSRLAELCLEAGVPPGVVNVVPGYGETAGAALAAHPDVDKVAFTGSHLTGQSIIRASAGNLKRVSLELGGKSPDIVFADADLDQAVPGSGMARACSSSAGSMTSSSAASPTSARRCGSATAATRIRKWARWCRRNSSSASPAIWRSVGRRVHARCRVGNASPMVRWQTATSCRRPSSPMCVMTCVSRRRRSSAR
jgi:aldehyde dehydrogenase (NAD+)